MYTTCTTLITSGEGRRGTVGHRAGRRHRRGAMQVMQIVSEALVAVHHDDGCRRIGSAAKRPGRAPAAERRRREARQAIAALACTASAERKYAPV
jgi:hypothetical protein